MRTKSLNHKRINLQNLKGEIDSRIYKIKNLIVPNRTFTQKEDQMIQTEDIREQKISELSKVTKICHSIVRQSKLSGDYFTKPIIQNPQNEPQRDEQGNQVLCFSDKYFQNSHLQLQKKLMPNSSMPSSIIFSDSKQPLHNFNEGILCESKHFIYSGNHQTPIKNMDSPQKRFVSLSLINFQKSFVKENKGIFSSRYFMKKMIQSRTSKTRIVVTDQKRLNIKEQVNRRVSEDRRQSQGTKVRENLLKRILEKKKVQNNNF